MDTTATAKLVASWPIEDQMELVFRLWDQITDGGWQPTPSPAFLAELDRRLAAYTADPTRVLSWEQVQDFVRRPR